MDLIELLGKYEKVFNGRKRVNVIALTKICDVLYDTIPSPTLHRLIPDLEQNVDPIDFLNSKFFSCVSQQKSLYREGCKLLT